MRVYKWFLELLSLSLNSSLDHIQFQLTSTMLGRKETFLFFLSRMLVLLLLLLLFKKELLVLNKCCPGLKLKNSLMCTARSRNECVAVAVAVVVAIAAAAGSAGGSINFVADKSVLQIASSMLCTHLKRQRERESERVNKQQLVKAQSAA